MSTLERCVNELVTSRAIDWVSAHEVCCVAAETGRAVPDDDDRRLSLRLIAVGVLGSALGQAPHVA